MEREMVVKIVIRIGVAGLWLMLCGKGWSQSPPAAETETIRFDTSLVVIDAQVINQRSGEFVTGLKAGDFILFDDGIRQEISHFSQDKLNLSVMLLLDLSGSVSPALNEIRAGALGALNRLKRTDEVAVMAFSSKVELVQDFTRDRELTSARIAGIERTPVIGQGTSLYQGLADAAAHLARLGGRSTRRIIIVITDNVAWEYRSTGLTTEEVTRAVLDSESMVCGLVVAGTLTRTEKIFLRDGDGRDLYRRRMTIDPFIDLTGGELLKSNPAGVADQLGRLVDHLRSRYSFGYTPKREGESAGYHRIELRLQPTPGRRPGEVTIRTRQGYRVGGR